MNNYQIVMGRIDLKITATILFFFLIILLGGEERACAAIYNEAQQDELTGSQEGPVGTAIKANKTKPTATGNAPRNPTDSVKLANAESEWERGKYELDHKAFPRLVPQKPPLAIVYWNCRICQPVPNGSRLGNQKPVNRESR